MPCPKSSVPNKNNSADGESNNAGATPYEKLMHSLHHDPKWLQEVNLGRRVGLYKFRCELGCGNFSQVKLAVHQLTKERVAIKIVDKGKLDDKMMRMLQQEISTMETIHHPNLIRLYEVVETYSKLYLVMEYASGGELYNRVTTNGKLEEVVARNLFAQICSAVCHMHERHIIHRDIKAENVFFSGPNRVKLGDFGFSIQLTEGDNQRLNTFCGSPPYAAPELFCDENYLGGPVDVWAMGILLYFMVVGRMPFKGQNVPTLKTNIVSGIYQVPKYLSKECADLIRSIIQQNPKSRLTVSEILSSAWLKGILLPSPLDAYQEYSLSPTVKYLVPGMTDVQYSEVERTARERLEELGITSQLLETQRSQGSKSHIIGSYRIIVHRVQKQLCSFLDVDGFLSPTDLQTTKKQSDVSKNKKLDNKFQLSNILSRDSSSEDLFSNCWRRKASSEDEVDAKDSNETKGKVHDSLSLKDKESLEKAQLVFLQNRASKLAKDGGEGLTPAVVRSRTCNIL